MAVIVGRGPPVNDAERAAIAHLRDHGPDDWLVLHNIDIPVRGDMYEVDLIVVMPHSVCVIDVKGTRGRIEVSGRRWYPSNRGSFHSPVSKLRDHARALKERSPAGAPASTACSWTRWWCSRPMTPSWWTAATGRTRTPTTSRASTT